MPTCGLPPAHLRMAIWDGGWDVHSSVMVDDAKGQTVIHFAKPGTTSVISVQQRLDADDLTSFPP